MSVPDTRGFDGIKFFGYILADVQKEIESVYPNETLLCLYGHPYIDNFQKRVLLITNYTKADIKEATPYSVTLNKFCEVKSDYIGTLHSHIRDDEQDKSKTLDTCNLSSTDYRFGKSDSQSSIMVILCSNGAGYLEFRNGEYGYFYWK
jgi:hypothetical protein